MIIKELILLSFGKFNKKKILLEDRMNIIYANNEVQKTTIHKFIECMFLGIKDGFDYCGILKYQHKDNIYRVERNFSKEKNEIKVFNNKTEEKMTNVLEYENTPRLQEPSSIHLSLNRVMFSNTMKIEQTDTKKNEELLQGVKESLMSIEDKSDGELSVDNVIEKLKQKINNIEKEKMSKSSRYGKVIKRIKVLEEEKEKSYTALIEINDYTMNLNKAREQLNHMIDEREQIRQDIKCYDKYERYNMFCEINTIEQEMKNLESKLETDLNYNPIPTQQYNDILRIAEKIKLSKHQVKTIAEKEKVLNKDIDLINGKLKKLEKLDLNDQIDFDLYNCESKEKELLKLKEIKVQFSDSSQKDKTLSISKDIDSLKYKRILTLCLIPLSVTLGVSNINLLAVPVILIIILFTFIAKEKDLKKKRIILEQLIEKAIYSEKDLSDKMETLYNEIYDILKEQSSSDTKELKQKKVSLEKQEGLNYEKQSYIKQIKDLEREKSKLTIYYQDLKLDLGYLLENNNFKDINHLNDMVEKRDRDEHIISTIESKRLILENLKSKLNLEKLNKEFVGLELEVEYINQMKEQDIDKIKQDYENKCESISDKKSKIKEIEGKIESLQINARNLVSIQEDINKIELENRKYDEDLKYLNIAKDTLESVYKDTKSESSPKLNKLMSDVISSITSKKHSDLKLEEILSIKIRDNSGKLIDLSCRNGGTMEQLFLSAKAGTECIKRENVPLILSDTFMKYDNQKLENIFKFLYKESLKRQIIIITCQKREIDILDKLKIKYKITKL